MLEHSEVRGEERVEVAGEVTDLMAGKILRANNHKRFPGIPHSPGDFFREVRDLNDCVVLYLVHYLIRHHEDLGTLAADSQVNLFVGHP